jgi:hypothetical protein
MSKDHKPKRYFRRDRHARNILNAARRRASDEFQVPMNAMVELKSLPVKARDKIVKALPPEVHVNKDFTTGVEGELKPILVPDPRRGQKVRGKQLTDALARREAQAEKIERKAKQRRTFATLTAGQKYERRIAGAEHRTPKHIGV